MCVYEYMQGRESFVCEYVHLCVSLHVKASASVEVSMLIELGELFSALATCIRELVDALYRNGIYMPIMTKSFQNHRILKVCVCLRSINML